MKKLFAVFTLVIITLNAVAQRGGRLGVVTGASNISIKNNLDNGVDDKKLALLPTYGAHYGIEAGYNFRYFGVSMQLMRSQAGQKYLIANTNFAQTRFTYLKPTLLLHFNSNPKKDVRFSGFIGGAYGFQTKFYQTMYYNNPLTGAAGQELWEGKTITIKDTNQIVADVSAPVFHNTDLSLVFGLGGEFRFSKKFLVGVHARMDMGMQALENLDKLVFKYRDPRFGGTVINYEPWKNVPYRFAYDPNYTTVRSASTNNSLGVFISLKYILFSNSVFEYEMDGY